MKNKHWYDYLWIYAPVYLLLGCFNILFGWLGMLEFCIPLIMTIIRGDKIFCNQYCPKSKFLAVLGTKLKLSSGHKSPRFLRSTWFRYGFLAFFMTMFVLMLINTVHVFSGAANLKQIVTLFWMFHLPWNWAYHGTFLSAGVAQFAFGLYSVMLTSSALGFLMMLLFKPRSWCVFCPMGTMTQAICKIKHTKNKV